MTSWFAYTQLHAWKETAAESIRVLQLMEDAGAVLYCTATSANASASASMTTIPVEFGAYFNIDIVSFHRTPIPFYQDPLVDVISSAFDIRLLEFFV